MCDDWLRPEICKTLQPQIGFHPQKITMVHFNIYLSLIYLTNSVLTAAAFSSEADLNCSSSLSSSSYSTSLRIAGIFIMLLISSLGMFSSLFLGLNATASATKGEPTAKDKLIERILQLSKMFGIGVIAGTAWTHLLPAAFRHFSAPCLNSWWAYYGTSWVGVFSLLAGFTVQNIEINGRDKIRKIHRLKRKRIEGENVGMFFIHSSIIFVDGTPTPTTTPDDIAVNNLITETEIEAESNESQSGLQVPRGSLDMRESSIVGDELSEFHTNENLIAKGKPEDIPSIKNRESLESPDKNGVIDDSFKMNSSGVTILLIDEQKTSTKLSKSKSLKIKEAAAIKKVSTIVMEMGVFVHSLIIGLTLGIASERTFPTLFLALSFHQLFEGIAMGVIVSDTSLSKKSKIALGVIYPFSTPIGIAIGIFIHSPYFESSIPTILLTEGILESLSSGILMYSTYCELIGGEINHSSTFDQYDSKFKSYCFLAMYAGAASMALVGAWA